MSRYSPMTLTLLALLAGVVPAGRGASPEPPAAPALKQAFKAAGQEAPEFSRLQLHTGKVDLPAGEGVIRLRGLATGVVPQSAVLEGLPAEVVERNVDFDL